MWLKAHGVVNVASRLAQRLVEQLLDVDMERRLHVRGVPRNRPAQHLAGIILALPS